MVAADFETPIKHLYVIGNGFDLYHGAKSDYRSFRKYLFRRNPRVVACFDTFFGPQSLTRSFTTHDGWYWSLAPSNYRHDQLGLHYPIATWSRSNLWRDFETNLSEFNPGKVFDVLEMWLPRVDEREDNFRYADYLAALDNISDVIRQCTLEMKYHLHRWVNTLHYEKGFRKRMLDIDKEAFFLNFNYSLFLESEYGIPKSRICYIHGSRRDKFGSLVLGHHSDGNAIIEQWIHKNQNRRRFRHVQKDRKGRYFENDKLAYLAFFHGNDESAKWRSSIRYYAVEPTLDRLREYYEANYKNTQRVIHAHEDFFDSLESVERITFIGCSLGAVDMDYFQKLRDSVNEDVTWEFSYHSTGDLKRIYRLCKGLGINNGSFSTFAL